jgi:hypothetical protein
MTIETATETKPQTNGDASKYESKFLPKVSAIPVVDSIKKQIYTTVPQAESLTRYVGDGLDTAFTYTKGTPIQGLIIKLDTLAASGMDKLEKEVPAVKTPTDEVLRKAKADRALDFFTRYYTAAFDFVYNMFGAYKGALDPYISSFLDRLEGFMGMQPAKGETGTQRVKHIGGFAVEKVDSRVTPIFNKTKETASSLYTDKVVPLAQYPIKQFNGQKDKATEKYSPLINNFKSRVSKAESAAMDAWTETKPDISGPNAVVPTIKSGIYSAITFGYNLVYPEQKKPSADGIDEGVQEQTNGLVSGVDLGDGDAKKRSNGNTS